MATKKKTTTTTTATRSGRPQKKHRSSTKTAEKSRSKAAVQEAKDTPTAAPTAGSRKPTATIDRRSGGDRRSTPDRRQKNEPVAVERRSVERRKKVPRRRQIDPTTCERDYTNDEIEFMNALDDYKRTSGRMFPTCSEVLEVVRGLGYAKPSDERAVLDPADPDSPTAPATAE